MRAMLDSTEFKQAESEAQASNNYVKLFPLLLPLAEKGNAEAQCYLASMYHLGNGVTPDGLVAEHWYKLSANQGYSLASNNLSSLYATGGANLAANPDLSAYWHKRALEQGFPS